MPPENHSPNASDQAVTRALRENLDRVQHTSDELHQAIGDVVTACGSGRPANALTVMLRAQTAAASISAALDVLARFVTSAVQSAPHAPAQASPSATHSPTPPRVAPSRPPARPAPPPFLEAFEEDSGGAIGAPADEEEEFDVNRLSLEEQELHRRANRVAKVSMQDIKMLRPEQVRLGRENKDICIRLRDDIEKAHREYDRRFKPIMDHPVDYFYRWLVEILADGDADALGDYPYASPARHR
jgi:hypothetical protein